MRLLVVVCLCSSATARADGPENLGHAIGSIAFVGELAIPDVRAEHSITTGDNGWVLSWPLALRSDAVGVGASYRVNLAHTVEYQYGLDRSAHRGVAVERLTMLPTSCETSCGAWSPIVELGGVLGQDGSGLVVGAGFGRAERIDDTASLSALGLVVRLAWTTEESRVDVAIDLLQIPVNAF